MSLYRLLVTPEDTWSLKRNVKVYLLKLYNYEVKSVKEHKYGKPSTEGVTDRTGILKEIWYFGIVYCHVSELFHTRTETWENVRSRKNSYSDPIGWPPIISWISSWFSKVFVGRIWSVGGHLDPMDVYVFVRDWSSSIGTRSGHLTTLYCLLKNFVTKKKKDLLCPVTHLSIR